MTEIVERLDEVRLIFDLFGLVLIIASGLCLLAGVHLYWSGKKLDAIFWVAISVALAR